MLYLYDVVYEVFIFTFGQTIQSRPTSTRHEKNTNKHSLFVRPRYIMATLYQVYKSQIMSLLSIF